MFRRAAALRSPGALYSRFDEEESCNTNIQFAASPMADLVRQRIFDHIASDHGVMCGAEAFGGRYCLSIRAPRTAA